MAYKPQASFAAGEIDPALHERTNFEKYNAGLATLRNAVIGKTGRVINRPGTIMTQGTKLSDRKVIIYSPLYSQYLIEWGHEYVRIHDLESGLYTDDPHDFTEDDLPYIQFVPSGKYIYVFRFGKKMKKMVLGPTDAFDPYLYARFLLDGDIFYIPSRAALGSVLTNTGTGYNVEYAYTNVTENGQESAPTVLGGTTFKLPINASEYWEHQLNFSGIPSDPFYGVTEVRYYRRPEGGNAFGYIGSTIPEDVGGDAVSNFKDLGEDADFSHSPPTVDLKIKDPTWAGPGPSPDGDGPIMAYGRTGIVYQQRFITTEQTNEEAIHASRTGYQNNFSRDYPLSADSALTFKAGTTGNAKVLRFIDNDGLFAFTTAGIYLNKGALTPENLAFDKKAPNVIDETVPPLEVPGAVLFLDKSTNTVRTLIYSNEAGGYPCEEISIFSNHLFQNRKIVSWAFQDGDIPLIWVVFADGKAVALTYQREHQMQAWSRHDTDGLIEQVTVRQDLANRSTVYFVVKRASGRYIERLTPRFSDDFKKLTIMDSAKYYNSPVNFNNQIINVSPQDPTDWAGPLQLVSNANAFANVDGSGAIGTKFKFFDKDKSSVTLEVIQYISTTVVLVQPEQEFPHDQASGINLYKTFSTLTGLSHLEGKSVSVLVDGYVVASPLNDKDEYEEIFVSGGEITLPDDMIGAFIHVGLPYASDVETLDIDTVEQKPALIESKIVHKVFVKVLQTRGLYIGPMFPVNNYVAGGQNESPMEDMEQRQEEYNTGTVGNKAQDPVSKRIEVTPENSWFNNGRICFRQVDPLPFELLSIIPDLSVMY